MEDNGFDESAGSFVGKLLLVHPVYGWGWSRFDSDASTSLIDTPNSFHARLTKICSYKGKCRWGIAKIEEPKHEYNGFWVVFSPRYHGLYNFMDRLTHFDVRLGPDEYILSEGCPLLKTGSPRLSGYAEIKAAFS